MIMCYYRSIRHNIILVSTARDDAFRLNVYGRSRLRALSGPILISFGE